LGTARISSADSRSRNVVVCWNGNVYEEELRIERIP